MRKTLHFLTIAALLAVLSSFASVHQAHAGALADIFQNTFKSQGFIYDATAKLEIKKGGETDFPFDFRLEITDKGGKSQENMGNSGKIEVELTNIDELPPELGDFRRFGILANYRGTVLNGGEKKFAELTNLQFSSDSERVMKIADMFNQMAKFVSGRSFSFSGKEFAQLLSENDWGRDMMGDQMIFLEALRAGTDIHQLVYAFGILVDDLVSSGVLIDDVNTNVARNFAIPNSQGVEVHQLRFGDRISQEGARQFDQAFVRFVRNLLPGFAGDFLAKEIENSPTLSQDLNDFLEKAHRVDLDLRLEVLDGLLQKSSFTIDFNAIGAPISYTEQAQFDYSKSYNVYVPQDSKSIIDLNKFVVGALEIGKLSSSSSNANDDYYHNPEFSGEGAHPGAFDLFSSIQFACPDYADKLCARREMMNQLKWVRNQYSARDFAQLRRELKAMVKDAYQ